MNSWGYAGDTLVLYGRSKTLNNLDIRRVGASGDLDHGNAVTDQDMEMAKQNMDEQKYERSRGGDDVQ